MQQGEGCGQGRRKGAVGGRRGDVHGAHLRRGRVQTIVDDLLVVTLTVSRFNYGQIISKDHSNNLEFEVKYSHYLFSTGKSERSYDLVLSIRLCGHMDGMFHIVRYCTSTKTINPWNLKLRFLYPEEEITV